MKSYIILPIYNREDILEDVLNGILNSFEGDTKIICILDGCTDSSEDILNNFISKNKIDAGVHYMNDVHEITCLNYGLMQIKLMNPAENDLVFTVQDDVILEEKSIDKLFETLWIGRAHV